MKPFYKLRISGDDKTYREIFSPRPNTIFNFLKRYCKIHHQMKFHLQVYSTPDNTVPFFESTNRNAIYSLISEEAKKDGN